MYNKAALILFLAILPISLMAQLINTKDSLYKVATMADDIKASYATLKADNKGKYKKYRDEAYDEARDYQIAIFKKKEIAADKSSQKYLQDLMHSIYVVSNATIGEPKVYLSKSPEANAFTTLDGIIVLHAGLFSRLENEDQLAFVLAHELSHHVNRHGKVEMDKYLDHYFSDEFQQELKKLSKQDYNKNKDAQELEKATMFNNRRHSRIKETEADADALIWVTKAGYNAEAVISALKILDGLEDEKIPVEELLKKYFNDASYPFKSSWTGEKSAFFGGVTLKDEKKAEQDSLKTHPDCKKRITTIQQSLTTMRMAAVNAKRNEAVFAALKNEMPLAILEYCLASDKISDGFYESLRNLHYNTCPEQSLLMMGTCFNKIFKGQKEHTLSKLVDNPSPYFAKDYNNLLQFFERLYIDDIATINYYFLKKQSEVYKANPGFTKEFSIATINYNTVK